MSRVMAGVKGGIGRGFAASLVPHVTCKHVRVICAARQLRLASLPRRHLGTCDGKCCGTRSASMLAVSGDQSEQVHACRSVASPSQRAERSPTTRGGAQEPPEGQLVAIPLLPGACEAVGGGTEAFARFNRRQLVLPGSTDMVPFGHSWRIGRSDFDRFWAFKLTTDKFTFLVQTWRLSRRF